MDVGDKKKRIIGFLLENQVIVNEAFLSLFDNLSVLDAFYSLFFEGNRDNEEKLRNVSVKMLGIDITKINKQKETEKTEKTEKQESDLNQGKNSGNVKVLFSYEDTHKKREFQDFVTYFNNRYNALKNMLMKRKNLDGTISISRALQKTEKEKVSIIGMVQEKRETKNGNIIFEIEDPTGKINVLASKNNIEQFSLAKDIMLDEVIGIYGQANGTIIFSSEIFVPDIPMMGEVKKSPDEAYAIFTSDLHYGSKSFYKEEFNKFLEWINGKTGTVEQKEIAAKTKYLIIAGDLIDGIGVYPGQENDLEIMDLCDQYKALAEELKKIPPHIKIVICAGNHDSMRIAEPQPPIYEDFAKSLVELPNIINVSNPSMINIHEGNGFPGFNILLYHGYSFYYYSENVESIRINGGMKRADLIMRYLLQRRHLAPTHTSTQYIPDIIKDNLVIDLVPDIFVSGHIHRVSVSNYRNVLLLNTSSWIAMTDYQEKTGLIPQPARAIALNLATRKSKILNFLREEEQEELNKAEKEVLEKERKEKEEREAAEIAKKELENKQNV